MSQSLRIVSGVPRGIEGNASRIKQCALELFDAQATKNPVMALTDAAALVSAVEDWLAQHHPSISLADLRTFSSSLKPAPVLRAVEAKGTDLATPEFVRTQSGDK